MTVTDWSGRLGNMAVLSGVHVEVAQPIQVLNFSTSGTQFYFLFVPRIGTVPGTPVLQWYSCHRVTLTDS